MAATMIACPVCARQVSSTARACPGCGAQVTKARRGVFGKLWVGLFWLFNALMLVWLIGGSRAATDGQAGLQGAELAGAQIGTGLGIAAIMGLWVIGSVILGLMALLTRPR